MIVRPLMDLDLVENVATAVLYGQEPINSPGELLEKAMDILTFTGLADKACKLPGELVLEDRKRLEVARALATRPKILLLDEVFAGSNSKEIEGAIDLTFRISREYGFTIFMIEHVMKGCQEHVLADYYPA